MLDLLSVPSPFLGWLLVEHLILGISLKEGDLGTLLVTRWTGTRLTLQGTQVPSLGQEDSTCLGAAKTMHHTQLLSPPSRA